MLLLIEFLIVIILLLVLITLYIDEHRTRHQYVPTGKMTRFWGSKERRRDVRIERVLTVRYAVEKKPHLAHSTLTKNISGGGILMEASEKLTIETLLSLEIDIPDHRKPIVADGSVAWVKENPKTDQSGKRVFDTGIKFINMNPGERELLSEYIKSIAP